MRVHTAVSPNYLERIADPNNRFHDDFLAYKARQFSRQGLIERLPHVAIVGDSLSRNVYVSTPLGTAWRAYRARPNGWFLNTEGDRAGIYSLFERLDELTPLVVTEYGGIGAMLGGDACRLGLFRRILRTRNFSGQVDRILFEKRFPDLILIWIGHNNVDWACWCAPHDLSNPEHRLAIQRQYFRENYERQVRRLVDRAISSRRPVAIIIYALANFASFFKARDTAAALREKNRELYPHLGADVRHFISMRPEYRKSLIRLVAMVNEDLSEMATRLQDEIGSGDVHHVQVRYSDALAKVDLSPVETIHPVDAWHPSAKGHNAFSEAAFNSLTPVLEFLRIGPPRMAVR